MYIDYFEREKNRKKKKVINILVIIASVLVAFIIGIFVGRIGHDKNNQKNPENKTLTQDLTTKDTSTDSSDEGSFEDKDDTEEVNIASEEVGSSEDIISSSEDTLSSSEDMLGSSDATDVTSSEDGSIAEEPFVDDFSDAVFIGDSRTKAFMLGTGLGNSHFYCETGINVSSAMTDNVFTLSNGQKGNLRAALSQEPFQRVYIMFGVNELGWPDPMEFGVKYTEVIRLIQELQPQAKIYVQSIIPVSEARTSKGDYVNNIQIAIFNAVIHQMTIDTGTRYLPVGYALSNEIGCLPADASHDGVHPNKEYCMKWLEYLLQNP